MQPMKTTTDDQVAETYLADNDGSSGEPSTDNIHDTNSLEPTEAQRNDRLSLLQTWHLSSLHLRPTSSRYSPRPTNSTFDSIAITSESNDPFPDLSSHSTHPNQESSRKTEFPETQLHSSQHTTEHAENVEDKKLDHDCDENNNLSASVTPSSDSVNSPENGQSLHTCLVLTSRPECLEKQKSVDRCRSFLDCKSPGAVLYPHRNCLLTFTWQTRCTDIALPCILGRISPPVWTSLALRESITVHPQIIRPTPQLPVIRNGFAINLNNVFQPIRESNSGDDLRGGSGCWSSSSEGVRSPGCIDSRRTSQDSSYNNSNDGNGVLWDYCDECRPAQSDDTDDDDDSDLAGAGLCLACRRGFTPTLGDLESFLATLPVLLDRGESPLTDERLDLTALEAGESARPGNPVADVLKHGGFEHFLPIDLTVHDGTGEEL